jgi:hypothetical protein
MASWKTSLLVQMLTLYNYLSQLFTTTKEKVTDFYYYIKDYFYGHHDMWLFIPGHTFPLSLSNLNNMIYVNWIYDNFDNSLTFSTNENILAQHCKLSWLSAKIRIITDSNSEQALEYDIDDFIEKFTVRTINNVIPSLYMIFLCWCAYTKHWFKANDTIQFHIINDMGEDIVLTIEEHNNSLVIKHNKLCLKVDCGEETEPNKPESNETTPLVEEEKKKDD